VRIENISPDEDAGFELLNSRLRSRACWSMAWKKASAMSPPSTRSQILVNTVTPQMASSMYKPRTGVTELCS